MKDKEPKAENFVQEFLFKDKKKNQYCREFDVQDLVNLLENYAKEYCNFKTNKI
jgi:hypothetical protein